MKRKNTDDRSDAKKLRILSDFDDKMKQVKEAFGRKQRQCVISIGSEILHFDPDNEDVNFYVAHSYYKKRNYTAISSYIEKLENIGTATAFCRANYVKGLNSIKNKDFAKGYEEMLAVKESGLFNKEMFPFPFALDAHLGNCALKLRLNIAKTHYENFMEQSTPHLLDDFSEKVYRSFNRALRHCDKEKYAQIRSILDSLPLSLLALSGDAFVNWNILTKVHQKVVEDKYPVIKQNLEIFAKTSLACLLGMNTMFTQETVKIIHAFLFVGF